MKSSVISTRTAAFPRIITEVEIFVAALVFVPFLVHLLPVWGDVPPGVRLLPIFFAPLVAAIHLRVGLAAALAALAPLVGHLLTGRPVAGMAVFLGVELLVFSVWVMALVKTVGPRWWLGPVAYLLSKPISGLLALALPWLMTQFSYGAHLTSAVIISWPGLIALTVLGLIAVQLKRRDAFAPDDGKNS